MDAIITWLSANYVEILGALAALVYLYFSVNRIIWLWPFGIITSLLYTWVFFHNQLYADMSLQVYYFFISIYGWYFWVRGKRKGDKDGVAITRIKQNVLVLSLLFTAVLTLMAGYYLSNYTDSALPYWDAFTTSASIAATWMLARKILENWLFWVVIDLVSTGMYIFKGLYPTAILFLVYTVIAVAGYYNWKKAWLK